MKKGIWMIVDINGNTLVEQCAYTDEEINSYVYRYMALGYRVARRIASPVNVIEMEPVNSDDERKSRIMSRVENLSDREKALLLAYLSERIQQVGLAVIWRRPRLRLIYEEISNIYRGTQDFKELLIASLRQMA